MDKSTSKLIIHVFSASQGMFTREVNKINWFGWYYYNYYYY